jgi:hypothetical protein
MERGIGKETDRRQMVTCVVASVLAFSLGSAERAGAIDVNLTMEEAKAELAAGREPMEQAGSPEEVRAIMQKASLATRVGSDPVKDPCGPSAVLRTKRFWLQAFGRKEAMESKKQKKDIRMPDSKIRKILETPHLEVEIQLCGDDKDFAYDPDMVFQQNSKNIRPIDVGPAQLGRKNEGPGPGYRSRFTGRFSYSSFDPLAKTKIVVFFPDGRLIEIPADFSHIR